MNANSRKRLQKLIKEGGLSNSAFAREIGINPRTLRSVPRKDNTSLCFTETGSGQFRLRQLYYVTDADKAWYKARYNLKYSDAYEVYGMKRTGCCGCPISYRAVDDLELIRPFEPNLVKAAYNVFGKSYEYRAKYNEYKERRKQEEKQMKNQLKFF